MEKVNMWDLCPSVIREVSRTSDEMPIFVFEQTSSTNNDAAEYARQFPNISCALFVADHQSSGRGRLGRSFLSRSGVGLYFSLLLGRGERAMDALGLTTYAAVAVCRVIERLTGLEPKIKWVNDIYIGDKKLGGILTEGRLSAEVAGELDYAIVGIGINVLSQELDCLDQPATDIESECKKRIRRDALAGELLRELLSGLDDVGSRKMLSEYRSRSMLVGRRVRVIKAATEREALVLGIGEGCTLHLKYDDGTEEFLNTGEVSTKLK